MFSQCITFLLISNIFAKSSIKFKFHSINFTFHKRMNGNSAIKRYITSLLILILWTNLNKYLSKELNSCLTKKHMLKCTILPLMSTIPINFKLKIYSIEKMSLCYSTEAHCEVLVHAHIVQQWLNATFVQSFLCFCFLIL